MATIDNTTQRLDLLALQHYGDASDDTLRTLVWANREASRPFTLPVGAVLETPPVERVSLAATWEPTFTAQR